MMMKIKQIYTYLDFEAILWISGLLFLAFSDPYSGNHFTLFVPSLLFDIPSPGFNLGHSISHFFHGNLMQSFETHPLGLITIISLLWRSIYLLRNSFTHIIAKGQV